MNSPRKGRFTRLKRWRSLPMIDNENGDKIENSSKKHITQRKLTAKLTTRGYKCCGRRSLGYAKRKKSKNEHDRDIQDGLCEDEGYSPSTSSTTCSIYRCIPALERSVQSSSVFLPSLEDSSEHAETLVSYSWNEEDRGERSAGGLVDRMEELAVRDRERLHREITQFLKKADKEKTNQSSMTQRVMSCALFGETLRFIVDKKYSFENILWLVLKSYSSAHLSGSNTIVGKAEWIAEDEKIAKLRKSYSLVLDKIKDFRFERILEEETDMHSLNRNIQFSGEYLENLRCAKDKVSKILDDYDKLVELYPHQNALWKSVNDERGSSERNLLESRMVSMRVWLNTLEDMAEKLKFLGDLFEISAESYNWFRPLDQNNSVFSFDDVHHVFRAYVKKSLNLKGMRRVLERIESITEVTLIKAAILMQRPPSSYAAATASKGSALPFGDDAKNRYGELMEWRFCNSVSKSLALPSLSNIFFFLLSIPMQMVVHWLNIRLVSDAPNDCILDELTFDAMITDSRDCVEEAVRIKKSYVAILQSMCSKCALPGYLYPSEYNNSLLEVFKKYVYYINCWSNCDSVRREPTHLFLKLEKEWTSARNCAVYVRNGLTSLCSTFCDVSEALLREIIENFLEDQIDEIKSKFLCDDEMEERNPINPFQKIMMAMNNLIREVKEREVRMFAFIRNALNDIYDASGYLPKDRDFSIPQILNSIGNEFCMIQLVMQSEGEEIDCCLPYTMFIDKVSSDKANVENILLTVADGKKPDEGCIVIVPDAQYSIRSEWRNRVVKVIIDEEIRICFTYLRDDFIIYIGEQEYRLELEKKFGKIFKCVAPSCSSNLVISSRIEEFTKLVLLSHLEKEQEVIDFMIGKMNSKNFIDEERTVNSLQFKLEKHFLIAFQIHRDVARIICDSFIENLGPSVVKIAIKLMVKWIEFLEFRNSPPSPYIPSWASPAFTFLQFITETKWTNEQMMCESDYMQLEQILEKLKSKLITSDGDSPLKVFTPNQRISRSTSSRMSNLSGDVTQKQCRRSQSAQLRILDEERERKDRKMYQFGQVITEDKKSFQIENESRQAVHSRAPFEYAELGEIASGSFGTVYRAFDLDSQRLVAIKVLRFDSNNSGIIETEVNIFRQLNNKYLVKYYGVEVLTREVHIFMEYCFHGTLETICQGKMDQNMVRPYTNCLLRAVNYLHENRIIHRDIKPANIFLDNVSLIKLGDFGCSSRLASSSTIFGEFGKTVGTPPYMAPEIFSRGGEETAGFRGYGRSVDIWSVGCTVVQMMTGAVPWDKYDMYQIAFSICFQKKKPAYPEIAMRRAYVKSFLDSCFVFEPDMRPSASDLLQSTFANVNIENDNFVNVHTYEPQFSNETSTPNSFQILDSLNL